MDWLKRFEGADGWLALGLSAGLLGLALGAGLLVYAILFKVLLRIAARPETPLPRSLVQRWQPPAKLLLPILLLLVIMPSLWLPEGLTALLRHLFSLLFIGGLAWLLASTAFGLRDLILQRYDVQARDNLKARAIHTQVDVLIRVLLVVIFVIAGASMLMTFDNVRQLGVSLLASAGIVGIIVGFAAQRSLATLVAGLQIAITQPIRIDDVVIVDGEWGRVEEITLTYVVVCIWDLRRLIVPITWFLEKPFQNWTRASAEILGTVLLHTDYSVPVAAVRGELERIVAGEELWDGKVVGLQVTNATDRTIELRALVSAADSGAAWNLRCVVREKLIDFIRREYPEALPRVRAEVESSSG
jgi:small-conductance mechanosensitive channel